MIERALSVASLAASLGAGLIAGVLFAFSSFVMPALARLPPAQGIAAMQSINIAALKRSFVPSFLDVFVGTGAVCAALAVTSLVRFEHSAALRLIGAVLYLIGVIGITRLCNIPRNDALASLVRDAPDAAAHWARYVASWTAWNHVRVLAGVLGAAILAWSLRTQS